MRNRSLVLLLVVAGLASTTGDPPIVPTAVADAAPEHARSVTSEVLPSSTTSTVEPSVVPISSTAQQVTLAFAGDVRFGGELARRLEDDPGTALAAVAPLLQGADLTVVNLETAITERGTPSAPRRTRPIDRS